MAESKYQDDRGLFSKRDHEHEGEGGDPKFPIIFGVAVGVACVVLGLLVKEPKDDAASQLEVDQFYQLFIHVGIMIYIGFGFLMTFLKRYSFSAIGYNLMLSAFVYIWNIGMSEFWLQVESGKELHRVPLSLPLMTEGLFGAGTVMITFGALLGRTTPSQMVVVAFFEIIFYSLNFMIGAISLAATDAGGSMFIHLFGATFGIAVASQLTPKGAGRVDHPYNGSRYTSDITAMIGTLALLIFWPSFNGILTRGNGQMRAFANTTLSLAGSTIAAFISSHVLVHSRIGWRSAGKFDMVHIQNASIAGGVAMGTCANLALNPVASIFIGALAGFVSTLGYHASTPLIRSKLGIEDTCGVWNLHGMPAIIGAVAGIIVVAQANEDSHPNSLAMFLTGENRTTSEQAAHQLYALLISFGIAAVGGLFTGVITKKFFRSPEWPVETYSDFVMWEVPDDYVSAGQAASGERDVDPRTAALNHTRDLLKYRAVVSPAVAPPQPPSPSPSPSKMDGNGATTPVPEEHAGGTTAV